VSALRGLDTGRHAADRVRAPRRPGLLRRVPRLWSGRPAGVAGEQSAPPRPATGSRGQPRSRRTPVAYRAVRPRPPPLRPDVATAVSA
jgi:hypothetical protein